MPKRIIFGDDGVQVDEVGGPTATVFEVVYDEPNDRVTMQPKSMAGSSFVTFAETAVGERFSVDVIYNGPEMRAIRTIVAPDVAVITDYHVILNGNGGPVTLDITTIMAPGNTIVVSCIDATNPCDVLGGAIFAQGLPPGPSYVLALHETKTFRFDPTSGSWFAW